MLCEVGAQARAPRALRRGRRAAGEELGLAEGLWATTDRPARARSRSGLTRVVGSRRLVRTVLARSSAFGAFVAAAPGARELLTITQGLGARARGALDPPARTSYDLVVVDAPGLRPRRRAADARPSTFAEIARVGPDRDPGARAVVELLEDPSRSAMVAVA